MDFVLPKPEELEDLEIKYLGTPKIPSPLKKSPNLYVQDRSRILVYSNLEDFRRYRIPIENAPSFELAGPRSPIYFDAKNLTCGLVTCGGVCPGLNDVIRAVVLSLYWQYDVRNILGFRYGFEGLSSNAREAPMKITPDLVDDIQNDGGTILGTSRGPQDPVDMVNVLVKNKIGILFVIGGNGTFAGAHVLAKEIKRRKLEIAIIGIPKTIDNDIYCSEKTFGFSTAVREASKAIYSAHEEAKSVWNGIGLVKLMGRDSGFISARASLSNSDVNFCLIPEVPVRLDGERGLLNLLLNSLKRKGHAVIVAAEGVGGHLIDDPKNAERDQSGNIRYRDIGLFLKAKIEVFFREKNIPFTLKYIDPSYTIRSCPANAFDSSFCLSLGQNAVHAGMAGKTDMFVGYWNHHFTFVPLKVAAEKKKQIDPNGQLWQTVLATTEEVEEKF